MLGIGVFINAVGDVGLPLSTRLYGTISCLQIVEIRSMSVPTPLRIDCASGRTSPAVPQHS